MYGGIGAAHGPKTRPVLEAGCAHSRRHHAQRDQQKQDWGVVRRDGAVHAHHGWSGDHASVGIDAQRGGDGRHVVELQPLATDHEKGHADGKSRGDR